MKELKLLGAKVKINASIKELPANRHSDFQKYLLQDAGVGSTIDDVNLHFNKLDTFLAAGQLPEAIAERTNLHYNLFYMLERIDIKSYAFACLIHSIDDEPITDFSESNLKDIIDRLSTAGLKRGHVEEIIDEVKKKLFTN